MDETGPGPDVPRWHVKEAEAMTDAGSPGSTVVVGIDGSAGSRIALKWAAGYAAATGATIRAVNAWHYPSAGPLPAGVQPKVIDDEVRADRQATVDGVVTEVFGSADPDGVTTVIAYGHPAPVLVEESAAADLLVVGHRGHGAFTGMLLGSVSIHCVTSARCPVVVVRDDQD
jgi:nucleotide-binding universal stress UspA family protein